LNPENKFAGPGRMIAGCLLGVLLAVIGPLAMLTEILSLMPVIVLPAIGLVFLYRWAGRGPAALSAALQMAFCGRYLGGEAMWIAFFLSVLPLCMLFASEKLPYFEQMRRLILAFGFGVVAAVAALYFSFGGNMIERILLKLPDAARMLPREAVNGLMASYGAMAGNELDSEAFFEIFDEMIAALVPVYQLNLPGMIFSGALISAIACTALSAWMLRRQGRGETSAYLPLREWALPASMTSGLLLITTVSFIMSETGINNGETAFYTALKITLTAFCIQALASMAGRLHAWGMKTGARRALLVLAALLGFLGGSTYIALYGCASAILGSRGVLKQRYERMNKHNQDNSSDKE